MPPHLNRPAKQLSRRSCWSRQVGCQACFLIRARLAHTFILLLQLKSGSYDTAREFLADVQLVWENCLMVRGAVPSLHV